MASVGRKRATREPARRRTGLPANRRRKTPREQPARERHPGRRPRAATVLDATAGNRPSRRRLIRGLGRLGRPLIYVVLIGVIIYGGFLAHRFVLQSPHFHVRGIDVSPTVHVTSEEIRRLAGIGPRTNIFAVNLDRVADRVRRHPWIAAATARRRLPNTVRITVREHEASAAVLMEDRRPGESRFYLVDHRGRAFKQAQPAELLGLPLITGIGRQEYLARPGASAALVRRAIALHRRYTARPGRPRIGEIHVDLVEGIILYTAGRAVQIRLGWQRLAAKLRRLDRVLASLSRQGRLPSVIRLDNARHPKRVTVRLADAGGTP